MKVTTLDPEGSNLIADLILGKISSDNVDYIGGLEMGADPIIVGVSLKSYVSGRPIRGFFVRKEAKQHGTRQLIERELTSGSQVLMVDDVTTTGGSVMKAVNAVRNVGCVVDKVITVVDREEGASENLRRRDRVGPALDRERFQRDRLSLPPDRRRASNRRSPTTVSRGVFRRDRLQFRVTV